MILVLHETCFIYADGGDGMATRKKRTNDADGKGYMKGAQRKRIQKQDPYSGSWIKYDEHGNRLGEKKTPGPWKGVRRDKY